jgi:lipopolysaccharide export LptBFGC system permease protein LptF
MSGADAMKSNQILAVALRVAGAILLYFGYQASQSLGDQLSENLTGRFTDSTTWYLVLGAVAALSGLTLLVRQR